MNEEDIKIKMCREWFGFGNENLSDDEIINAMKGSLALALIDLEIAENNLFNEIKKTLRLSK